MEPNATILRTVLTGNGVEPRLIENVLTFFLALNGKARETPLAAVGHTFFLDVATDQDVRDVWNYQLKFLIEKAYRLNPDAGDDVRVLYRRLFEPAGDTTTTSAETSDDEESPSADHPPFSIEGSRQMALETQAAVEAANDPTPEPIITPGN